jgi:predicted CXXCH cytochrome family protein
MNKQSGVLCIGIFVLTILLSGCAPALAPTDAPALPLTATVAVATGPTAVPSAAPTLPPTATVAKAATPTSLPTTAPTVPPTAAPAVATSASGSPKDACLACHGPFDKLIAATADYTPPNSPKQSPHRYVPHDSKDVPECSNCHQPHPVPLTSTVGLLKANVQWCFGCHHKRVLECGTCHAVDE